MKSERWVEEKKEKLNSFQGSRPKLIVVVYIVFLLLLFIVAIYIVESLIQD